MQTTSIQVTPREPRSRTQNRQLRSAGLVPANIYGPGTKNEYCALSEKELRNAFKHDLNQNFIINLQSEGSSLNGKKVILKSIERDPASWKMMHIDLYEISMERPLTVEIPIHYVGIPDGVKNEGGIQDVIRRKLLVRGLPQKIPDFIEVDISHLQLNETLHVSDVKVPADLQILDSLKFSLVSVVEPEKEEAATPVAAEGAAAAGEGAAAAPTTEAAAAAADDKKGGEGGK